MRTVTGLGEFNSVIAKGQTLVDFFAEWCGPCKKISPFLEELATKYPSVQFIKVDVDQSPDVASSLSIRSMPTFHFYENGVKKDEVVGANPSGIEQLIQQHLKKDVFESSASSGNKLGGNEDTPMDAREARLKAFAKFEEKSKLPLPAPSSTNNKMDVDDDDAAVAIAVSVQEKSATETTVEKQDAADSAEALKEVQAQMEIWDGEEMVPLPVDEDLLKQLMDMGFSDTRARKGIHHGTHLDGAIAWITEHQEDADIDQAYMVKKKDAIPKVPLTPEELAARVEETKKKIIERRALRAKQEKEDAIKNEKERRERGKQMAQTQDQRDATVRKHELEKLKREKNEAARERERVLAEIKRDKELRKANNGKLPSVLGVEGYNPSIASMNDPNAPAGTSSSTPAPVPVKVVDDKTPEEKIDQSIERIMRYRTGGDGGNALKLLYTFVKNIAENPNEQKYRSINSQSNAFLKKLAPLTGPVTILKALGFTKNDEEKFVYPDNGNMEMLKATSTKLQQAEETYKKMNPN